MKTIYVKIIHSRSHEVGIDSVESVYMIKLVI